MERRIYNLIDARFLEMQGEPEARILDRAADSLVARDRDQRFLAVINDRLHRLSVYALLRLCRSMNVKVSIAYAMGQEGIYAFDLWRRDEHDLLLDIWQHSPEAGTPVTVIAKTAASIECATMVSALLTHFREFDEWLRGSRLEPSRKEDLRTIVQFTRDTLVAAGKPLVLSGRRTITNALPLERVFAFDDGSRLTKEQVLHELTVPHAVRYNLPVQSLIVGLLAVGPTQLREGFVYAHCKVARGPRVSASLGRLRVGIEWYGYITSVRLVLVVVGAADTPRSQAEFVSSFARMIYRRKDLLPRLVDSRDAREAFDLLVDAERQYPERLQ